MFENEGLAARSNIETGAVTNNIWQNELMEIRSLSSNRAIEKTSISELNIEKSAGQIADLLNQGRSDLAVSQLSKNLMQLDGQSYNKLLIDVVKKEAPGAEGDDRGHLLLSEWNNNTDTWDHVYVEERDQLYRIVQPGNTLESIAHDRLGVSDAESIQRYVGNIADANSLSGDRSITKGQALKLPYPS